MSERYSSRSGGHQHEAWEARLRDAARAFPYPATPAIAAAVRAQLAEEARLKPERHSRPRSRLIWAGLVVLFVLAGLLAVPQVRAKVVEFLQIGAIRIFLVDPTPASTPLPSTASPPPSPTPIASLLDLAGATTLEEAQQQTDFSIRLPTYPADLDRPDAIFLQELGGPVVVLLWLDDNTPDKVRLSLTQLGPGTFAEKGEPRLIQETTVNGQPALWTTGPYLLQIRQAGRVDYGLRRLVEGHTLLWVEAGITYRLETGQPLAEAVKVAESLP